MATVLFYNHTGLVSGAERVLLLIVKRLDRERFTPVVVSPRDGTLGAECESHNTAWQEAPVLAARFTFNPLTCLRYCANIARVAYALRRSFIENHPAFIHANSIRAGIVATLSTIGTRIPILWHLHDFLPVHPVSAVVRLLALCSRRTFVVGCSAAVVHEFKGNVFPPRSRRALVARNGIEARTATELYSRSDKSTRASLGLSPASFVVGIVGQISPRKGQETLIRAFATFVSECPEAQGHLLVVGAAMFNRDHEYAASLHSLARDLQIEDRVHFLGLRKDVAALLRTLDLLVLNSTIEPLALVILEAMLEGTPVLATDSGGCREIIEHGVNGHLIPVADQTALEKALAELYQDPELRKQYKAAGPGHIRRHFSATGYMETIHNIYDGVLRTAPSSTDQAILETEKTPVAAERD